MPIQIAHADATLFRADWTRHAKLLRKFTPYARGASVVVRASRFQACICIVVTQISVVILGDGRDKGVRVVKHTNALSTLTTNRAEAKDERLCLPRRGKHPLFVAAHLNFGEELDEIRGT